MTKQDAIGMFLEMWREQTVYAKNDTVAKVTEWNDFTDMLNRNGDITNKQYANWSNPF